ncbi:Uncharacterized protein FWK35_00034722 [Aphis craccivora]|uniref:Uncharacterized protein n=1 Tax=Aphis craccivora TaxID=307492 RepID=A0A6G0VIQ9_APHCR|nr:Uncharacterized protein FWK35_00034722 [Aphis craccivora]
MGLVKSPGFNEIRRLAIVKPCGITPKILFLRSLMPEMIVLLKTHVQHNAIKFNLKLEATYNRPNVPNSSENRAFKTVAVEIFHDSDIDTIIERVFIKLMGEQEECKFRGSGFNLESIDGLLFAVYKYTPMSGSSYIELPAFIERKHVSSVQFWLNVMGQVVCRIGENYKQHENKYNFEGLTFPTLLLDVVKFEKNNANVFVIVYGLDKKFQPLRKYPTYEVYRLRVADEEKTDHFDLLLVTDGDNIHYVYISNFFRLIRKQKTGHDGRVVFCKKCFTSFDNRNLKYKLSGQKALDQHKLICGAHKPILPEM